MSTDVFISYSRKDAEVAARICSALDKAGLTYFIDKEGISGGEDFPKVISEAILDSSVFLFIASRNSYESKFVGSEVTYAYNHKKKEQILPYIVDGSELPTNLEFLFSDINVRNLKDHPVEEFLAKDVEAIISNSARVASEKKKGKNTLALAAAALAAAVIAVVLLMPGPKMLRSEESLRQYLSTHTFEATNGMTMRFSDDLTGVYMNEKQMEEAYVKLKEVLGQDLESKLQSRREYEAELESGISEKAKERVRARIQDLDEDINDLQQRIEGQLRPMAVKELSISKLSKRKAKVDVLFEGADARMEYFVYNKGGKGCISVGERGMEYFEK